MGHLSFGGILLVALCIANAYSPHPAMAAETQPAASASEPEAANVLAKALIAMRQATRAAGDSGSAEAWVTIDHLWKTSRYVKPSHRIVFRFKGNDSRSEGYRPAPASQPAATVLSSQEPQLEYVRLITHEREITYASLSPTDKGECAVYRFPADNHNEFIGAMDWSYFSLTSVPDYVDHEFDIIEAAAQRGTRKRQGHTVLLEYNATFPPDCPTTVQKVVMVFDMTLGGMMSRYEETMVDVDLDTNEEHRSVAVMETDWQRQGAQVVPVKRTIEVIGRVNGKQTSHAQNTVEFRHWKFEAIDPAEFTFQRLGVPVGAQVRDGIYKIRYEYFKGAEEFFLGRIAPRDHATVEVTFDASGFWRKTTQELYIDSDDDTRPLIAIPLEAYVKVGVQLDSRTVYLGSGHFGDMLPSQHTRLLRDPAGRQPTVTFARVPSEVTITGDAWAKYEEVEVYPIKIQALPLNRPPGTYGAIVDVLADGQRFPLHLSYTIAPMMTCDPLSATLRWESSGVFPHASIKLRWPRSEQVVLEETSSLHGKCTARAALSNADEGMLVVEAKTGVQPDDFDVLIVSYRIRDGKRCEQIYIPVSLIN